MEPISTYRERVPRGLKMQSRVFQLYSDHVAVHFRWGEKTTDLELDLKMFRPTAPVRGKTRLAISKKASLTSFALLMVIFLLLLMRSTFQASPAVAQVLLFSVFVVIAPFIMAVFLTYRYRQPVDVVKFVDTEGKVALDILRCGPDAKKFEEFSSQVLKQIRKQQG